ncbi:MAG: alpha/beta hydrolase [Synergistaceae bacterium]|jgi:pimeloyl-ACP methyl ester carboxylesterase|nr:alpha/beta hydrolase [Synergistaceae bacterium]
MDKMRLNGIDVNYYDRGSGDAILFLHGWGSDFSAFRPFLDRLAGARRVCAPNLPGFGGSGEPPAPWGVDDYADFSSSFLEKLGIQAADLIGHSFGGRVVIKLAIRNSLPFRVSKVVLVDGAGIRHPRTTKQKLRLLLYKGVKGLLSLPFLEEKFSGLLESWRRKNASPDYLNASPRMRECLVKTVNEDLTPFLSSIPYPTLLVWGENDRETPLNDGKIMERLIPDAGLVELKNAGHYSFLDQPLIFGRVLDSFFAS